MEVEKFHLEALDKKRHREEDEGTTTRLISIRDVEYS